MKFEPIARNRSAEIFLLGAGGENTLTLTIELDHTINGAALQRAVDEALRRHPLFASAFAVKDECIWYAKNDLPVIVSDLTDDPVIGGKETNYHLFEVHFHENVIYMGIHHALSDGVGINRFLETMFYYYFCDVDKTAYPSDGIGINDGREYPGEWEDPFGSFYEVDDKPESEQNHPSDREGLVLPENQKEEKEYTKFRIRLNAAEFMQFVKSHQTSPAVASTLLMMRALRGLYPNEDKLIRAKLPVDLRARLGIPETLRNCVVMKPLNYDPRVMDGMDFTEQAKLLRSALKAETTEDALKREANGYIGFMGAIEAQETIERKRLFLAAGRRPDDTAFLLSYMPACKTSGNHIRSMTTAEKEPYPKFNIFAMDDVFLFDLLQSFSERRYIEAFTGQLAEFGFSAAISEERYRIPQADVTEMIKG
ncbi:MAG: hypothetical protein IJ682_12195 [Lachnospiraceae bacterium]|nr:hypothetical protein [Lachnospiraceae bacterium]